MVAVSLLSRFNAILFSFKPVTATVLSPPQEIRSPSSVAKATVVMVVSVCLIIDPQEVAALPRMVKMTER
jgi:hypothetical protein